MGNLGLLKVIIETVKNMQIVSEAHNELLYINLLASQILTFCQSCFTNPALFFFSSKEFSMHL